MVVKGLICRCKGVKGGQTEKERGKGAHCRDKIVELLLESDD